MESFVTNPEADSSVAEVVVDVPAVLWSARRTLLAATLGAAGLSLIVALAWPSRYTAVTKILPPQQKQSAAAAILSQFGALGSVASMAQGEMGLRNPNDMYVGMLKSRTIEDAILGRFDLVRAYGTRRISDARKELERASDISSGKDGFISISVEDKSPKRAAEMANAYVEQLQQLTQNFATTEAGQRRLFFEQQLENVKRSLATAEEALKTTQQRTGVIEIDSQAKALIEAAVKLRAEIAAKEVQVQAMRSFATDSNPDLRLAEQELAGLRSQVARMTKSGGGDGDLEIATGKIPDAGLEYLRKLRELKYQEALYEVLSKQTELARLDEARAGSVIQVLDRAVEPDVRSSPKRGLIVVLGTIFGLFGCAVTLVGREVYVPQTNRPLGNLDS